MPAFSPNCEAFTEYDAQSEWCITIGNFDGFHLGHQFLVQQTLHQAQKNSCLAALVTFSPHPKTVLLTNTPFYPIYDQQTKVELARASGLNAVFTFTFTPDFATLSPAEFLKTLFKHLNIRHVVVGYDFCFGAKRSGSIASLKQMAGGIGIQQINPKKLRQTTLSSTMIRRLLFEQDFAQVKKLLGRCWHFNGTVQSGQKLGTKLGFPTANTLPTIGLPLPNGVYLAYAKLNGQHYRGVMNFGTRPTVQPTDPQLEPTRIAEIHLLFGFNQEIPDQAQIRIFPCKNLRPEKKFESLEQLKAQIHKDVQLATSLWQADPWHAEWLSIKK